MIYVVVQPSYNFAHWLPHDLIKGLGVPYSAILWFEQNADKFLHFVGSLMITYLIIYSDIRAINRHYAFIIVILLCSAAEYVQFLIGRGYNSSDLLLGILGSFVAYLQITKNKHRRA